LSTKIKFKDKEIAWRRSKVIELRGYGLSQTEIAKQLQVTDGTISLDMQYLREQAKASLKEYTTEALPMQYQVCLSALDMVLQNAFVMMQKAEDNREKLHANELFKDTRLVKLELLSNATTIDHALEYIRNKQRSHPHQKKNNEDASGSPITATAYATATGRQSVF
jgi:IS30 family transposase